MTDLILGLETLVLVVLLPVTLVSARYLNGIYKRSPAPRMTLFRALIANVRVAVAVAAYFTYTIIARAVDIVSGGATKLPVLPVPWPTIVAAGAIIGLMIPTCTYALAVWRMRRP